MTITGTIHFIGPVENVGANGFTKQLLVVKTDQQYDNLTPIEFAKDKTAILNGLRVGQLITVYTNVGGREYNGKYYPSIRGWKVEANQSAPPAKQSAPAKNQSAPVAVEDDGMALPF